MLVPCWQIWPLGLAIDGFGMVACNEMDFKLVMVLYKISAHQMVPTVKSSYIRFFRFFASPRIHLLFDGPPVDVRGPEVCLQAVYEFQCYGGDDGDLNLGGWSIKRSGSVFFCQIYVSREQFLEYLQTMQNTEVPN